MILDKGSMQSNLECFLECITPVVQSQFLHKTEIRDLNVLWHPWEREKVEYFTLGDLWNCFDEWSAYGAGVPILLNNNETLVQYYVPYLSAIQISLATQPETVQGRTESGDCETRDSFSDSCSDESEILREINSLWKIPLMDKISGLAQRYPGLMSLRSVDLSQLAGWQLPGTRFITFQWGNHKGLVHMFPHIPHPFIVFSRYSVASFYLKFAQYSPSYSPIWTWMMISTVLKRRRGRKGRHLTPSIWFSHLQDARKCVGVEQEWSDQERVMSLLSVADSWAKTAKGPAP
ncbi:hypothetical protein CK203_014062 [Vitis vinifera]|uniref:Uncharacterized protein n=1 Tax=Vitis vinifera TaxID=29760 RepID=A0A438JHZ0_VITVI|nr:hypothetical protein CK203_014062 [Vitis vinifera]